MTEQELLQLAAEWDSYPVEDGTPTSKFSTMLTQLQWFGRGEWAHYIPAQHPSHSPTYMARLARWIGNTNQERSRKLMLEYALQIAFFSESDFSALYQSAFVGPITRWVIDRSNLRLTDDRFEERVHEELYKHTWFCGVTDSLRIGDFYHANQIVGISRRPAFIEYFRVHDAGAGGENLKDKIEKYMDRKRLTRLVLIEDVAGSGNQSRSTLRWVLSTFDFPVLFVPLIICPEGIAMGKALVHEFGGKFAIAPIIRVQRQDLLGPERQGREFRRPGLAVELEGLADETFADVAGPNAGDCLKAPYGPFGYRDGGCSIVTFTNTPDNSLPMIHYMPETGVWQPLFPRSSRV
jgi:hypothetical protein